jgi:hypothetical protein
VDRVEVAVAGGPGEQARLDVELEQPLLFVWGGDLQGRSFLEELTRQCPPGGVIIDGTGVAREVDGVLARNARPTPNW